MSTQVILGIVKPDASFHFISIIRMFLDALPGSKVIYNESLKVSADEIREHYKGVNTMKYGRKIAAAISQTAEDQVSDEDTKRYADTIMPAIVDYMANTNLTVFLIKYTGELDAFKISRDLLGATDPAKAEKETVRGKFSGDKSILSAWVADGGPFAVRNACHISDSAESAFDEACIYLGLSSAREYFSHLPELCNQAVVESGI
jgi:nucleoside diphosphate kinase